MPLPDIEGDEDEDDEEADASDDEVEHYGLRILETCDTDQPKRTPVATRRTALPARNESVKSVPPTMLATKDAMKSAVSLVTGHSSPGS